MKFDAGNSSISSPHLVKLKSEDSLTGVLRGEVFVFEHSFKSGEAAKFRFRLNFIVKENGVMTAKILENGRMLYNQLRDLSKAGWNLEESYTKISRVGNGPSDTRWSATCLPTPVPIEILDKVKAVPLLPLDPKAQPQVPSPEAGEDLPF